jgi:hypothetical protein
LIPFTAQQQQQGAIYPFVVSSNMAPVATIINESNIVPDRNTTTKHESAATRLRNNLETGAGLIVCPGVYDGLSARIALDVGFDALYMVRPLYSLSPLHNTMHDSVEG